jgi:hypothetical protein
MTPSNDELGQIWNSPSGGARCDTAALVGHLERKTRGFDRTIRYRDLRESAGGLVVTVIFLWFAFHDRSALELVAHLWLAGCGVWVMGYLWRYSKATRQPAPEQALVAYQQQLVERYDRQIRLLKSAKYWYILPFWAGLLFDAYAAVARTGRWSAFGLEVGIVTLINAGLWWLNEGPGVRYLRKERQNLLALTGDGAA